ncbi:NAD(P)-dependent oxidoreductase [Paraburkholderia nemoris]|uniref:2-(Hydroxymethyl)glutarate dehydrogenase n=1 Tax=Paraburkholderia nemoris TaxID=2793076 RepID=A0ABM8RI10_9BURK|nr:MULTISPECIES: NAD(P)-dependent oxidoreductase [Paraburkholderia]MBK3812783.1 NAD(P)-dependent oxidoreductase [Paraburkholderia aspalathi]CAE6753980.1 2-(hydroxymethyl)glutarate dehydrogenase [Paraburkholderia nemoris]CAE6808106.1 2-(hydroxymethyl)glutarate dehydrogenase [Paraburkholderia nemoris]
MKVAFIGVGRMGGRMAARLVAAGHQVRVFDPSRAAVEALASKGAVASASPADAALDAERILLSLPSPKTLRDAVTGENGVLKTAAEGSIIVDFSTVDPATTKEIAAAATAQKVGFVDSPVSGGVAGAENGQLVLMVGGPAELIEKLKSVFDVLAGRVVHCGDTGAGQLTKLSHNLLTAINTVALGEVLTASVKAGAKLDVLCDVLTAGLAGSKMLDYLPKTLFTAERPANFAIDLMHKDIKLCLDEFSNLPMPLGQLVLQTYNAARAKGLGGKDSTSVNEIYEELLGVRLSLPVAQ